MQSSTAHCRLMQIYSVVVALHTQLPPAIISESFPYFIYFQPYQPLPYLQLNSPIDIVSYYRILLYFIYIRAINALVSSYPSSYPTPQQE